MNALLNIGGEMLGVIVLFLIIAIIFFRRSGSSMSLQALPFSTIWNIQTNQKISAADVWPFLKIRGLPGENQESFSITATVLKEGQEDNVPFRVVRFQGVGSFGSMTPPWTEAVAQFPGAINGTIESYRIGELVRFGQNESQLESIDFNKRILLKATSKKLAFQVFSPDSMDFYLRLPQAPAMHFSGHELRLISLGQQSDASIIDTTRKMIRAVLNSGALELKGKRE